MNRTKRARAPPVAPLRCLDHRLDRSIIPQDLNALRLFFWGQNRHLPGGDRPVHALFLEKSGIALRHHLDPSSPKLAVGGWGSRSLPFLIAFCS